MRCKLFFITGIMGLGIISGIIKGLSTPRGGAKKEEEKIRKNKERVEEQNPSN